MGIPSFTLAGTDRGGDSIDMFLNKELSLHGDFSTMASLQVGGDDILLTISNLRALANTAIHLADALEYGEY